MQASRQSIKAYYDSNLINRTFTKKKKKKKFSSDFSKVSRKFCLSLHFNGDNSYLFANRKEIMLLLLMKKQKYCFE